ncbi:hypothetical protein ACLIKD_05770 [Azonexus sp. IMCC34842]|uniref:hypothetical protein n=1 Tax=Azonexus sp. IMCC34842 TaxID=3420950 RepID=UPI003D0A1B97
MRKIPGIKAAQQVPVAAERQVSLANAQRHAISGLFAAYQEVHAQASRKTLVAESTAEVTGQAAIDEERTDRNVAGNIGLLAARG